MRWGVGAEAWERWRQSLRGEDSCSATLPMPSGSSRQRDGLNGDLDAGVLPSRRRIT
ncbi:MAG: hypothetical protein RQ859_04935 [Pyrobaculum sp.]|nr:hypothetical protein [Pyrobaculum sp.]